VSNPLISVIIPTYNRANIIAHTIENIFAQTYKNFELIVIDDGSTDNTQAVLREFGSHIRVITQDNAGPAAARNRGIDVSRGEIIAFQDSDDLWKPSKLERQIALLSRLDKSVPCCLCNAFFRMVRGREYTSFDFSGIKTSYQEGIWLNVAEVLATRFVLFNQTVAIRRSAIEKAGSFDEKLKYLEDYDLTLRLAMEGPWAFIREPLVIWREGAANSLSQQAGRDPIVLKEYEINIFEQALTRATGPKNAKVRRQLSSRLRVFRRGYQAARLRQSQSTAIRTVGRIVRSFECYRNKAFTNSPWYPRAETVPLENFVSLSSGIGE
jgi:glycosyltransferase involved in cell wall biosynthesis